jgi:hypothetical protein
MHGCQTERSCCDSLCTKGLECPAIYRAPIERCRPGLWRRFVRWVHGAMISADIAATEQWIADCTRDGIMDSRSLDACRKRLGTLRVDLALLRAGF